MRKEDVVIGKPYLVRKWDDLAAEFGVDGNGHIAPSGAAYLFTDSMLHYCGTVYTPTGKEGTWGELLPPLQNCGEGVEAWMLEPIAGSQPTSKPVGMYGETPRVAIGKFSICRQDDSSVWIQIEGEEGFQLQDDIMEAHMQEIFDKRF